MSEQSDPTNPPHYADCPIEPILFLLANDVSPCIFNVVKYCIRSPRHWDPIGSLLKARQYLDWEIERIEQKKSGWRPYLGPLDRVEKLHAILNLRPSTADCKPLTPPLVE